ncbi:MAG: pilus assembly protein TadG-related protein [Thermoguttaceae bacterium]
MNRNNIHGRSATAGLTKRQRSRHRRAGYVLVLFVMLFLGLLGLAALVIDMGFARLTQCQMQTAVDSAALEGLRRQNVQTWQDLPTAWLADPNFQSQVGPPGTGSLSPQQIDKVRRWAASQVIADGPVGNGSSAQPSMFADNVETSGGTLQYGAGPVVNFSGGIGPTNLTAAQNMTVPNSPVYQPLRADGTSGLELNLSNATEGDMVAGTYNPGQPSAEADNYSRADFTPAPTGSSLSSSSTGNAFLVRVRRTNNINGLDQEPGVSSAGPTLPILFGRGSMMARSGSPGQLSAASGITVRATAIAGPQPAKTVGPLYTNSSGSLTAVAQLAPFAITDALWTQVLSSGTATTVINLPDPRVQLLQPTFSSSLTAIGQPLATTTDSSAMSSGTQSAVYVPIYANYTSQQGTIIGFVYNNWSYQSGTLTLGPAIAVRIGGQNVSPTMALPLPAVLAPADVSTMFQDHATLFNQYPLYSPALVNRYIGTNPSGP